MERHVPNAATCADAFVALVRVTFHAFVTLVRAGMRAVMAHGRSVTSDENRAAHRHERPDRRSAVVPQQAKLAPTVFLNALRDGQSGSDPAGPRTISSRAATAVSTSSRVL